MVLELRCGNFLKDNHHVYAIKAARKKIAMIRLTATNRGSSGVQILLSSVQLLTAGKTYQAERPAAVYRKLTEFTWDFLLYSIIDFHPLTAVIDVSLFLTGPLYNWRLKRQLKLLSDGEVNLAAGESLNSVVAFRGVSGNLDQLNVVCRCGNGDVQQIQCEIEK